MHDIILVNRFFHPDHSATSQLASDLASHLAASGFKVSAIASRQLYDQPSVRLGRIGYFNGVSIFRVATTHFGRRNLLGRAIDYLSFYLTVCFALFRNVKRGSIVIALTDPPLVGVFAALAVRHSGGHCVQWTQDVFPEVAERLNILNRGGPNRILRFLRNWSLVRADVTVAIGLQMAKHLSSVVAVAPEVIPNWALEELTDDQAIVSSDQTRSDHPLRTAWGLGEGLIVGYSGNMGRAHRLDELLDAASELRSEVGLRFLFVGGGAQRDRLVARSQSLELENVAFQPYQPREKLRETLTLPDIHVVSLDARLEGLIVPSKFVGVIALGRPVLFIGAPDGEIGSLIRSSGCGIVVAPGDSAALVTGIKALCVDRACGGVRLRSMSNDARTLWKVRFQRKSALESWARLIETITANR